MMSHTWVRMQFTPIIVTPEIDGSLTVEATEGAIEISTEEAIDACWFCHMPLKVETYQTECIPEMAHEK